MIETPRLTLLSNLGDVIAGLDNNAPDALHYYDDTLHEYLKGSACTFTFKAPAQHEDAEHLVVGNKISFRRGRDYYLNIMHVERDEYEVEVECMSLNLELLNTKLGDYAAPSAMSFAQYVTAFGLNATVTLGLNEVSDKSIKHEWTGEATVLARLFSLATVFEAEIEFVPKLADNGSLSRLVMNVYKEHSDENQGMGQRRDDLTLRYRKDVDSIKRTADITELYTMIRPTGKDDLTISSLNKTEYDANGQIEYRSPSGDDAIYAVQAVRLFPSNLMEDINDAWITADWSYDTDNAEMLYGQALAQLKKHCMPDVSYEVSGYYDLNIGDTVPVVDEAFNPTLYLEARVTEQEVSFTDPSLNKTTLDNFRELQSQIDSDLIAQMRALIEANAVYQIVIASSDGITFKNAPIITTLTALVYKNSQLLTAQEITSLGLTITWAGSDGTTATGSTLSVNKQNLARIIYTVQVTGG